MENKKTEMAEALQLKQQQLAQYKYGI